MSAILTAILSLLTALGPSIGGSSAIITEVISALTTLIPVVIQEAQDLLPMVKSIIATLKGDSAATQAQLDALDALDKQVDDAFDAAAAAAQAEDGTT